MFKVASSKSSVVTIFMTIFLLSFVGFIWADTNGVWHRAEDVRGGIFGADEQDVTSYYTFINPVNINSDLTVAGVLSTPSVVDSDNAGFYLNSSDVSVFNAAYFLTVVAPEYYDLNDSTFYVDPAGTSNMNRIDANIIYLNGQDLEYRLENPDFNYAGSNSIGGSALGCDGGGDGCDLVLEKRTDDPSSPAIGQMWLRTDLS